MEWLPKPKVSGFEGGATSFTYTETADVSSVAIRYTASMPVQDVEFALDFQDEQYMALNKTYTLSMLGDEDRATLTDAGITVPTLDGTSTDGVLDLTGLTANLRTNAGAEVVNQLSLRVKANNRWSSEDGEVYTIRTIKPEFTVNVQDVNCWSKEFTVDEINVTSGNADKIKGNLVYQYSTDEGSTWQECNNVRRQAFSSIPANKNYKVRACYRGCIHSNIANATLETPLQLPNSDMESWQANKVEKRESLAAIRTIMISCLIRVEKQIFGGPLITSVQGIIPCRQWWLRRVRVSVITRTVSMGGIVLPCFIPPDMEVVMHRQAHSFIRQVHLPGVCLWEPIVGVVRKILLRQGTPLQFVRKNLLSGINIYLKTVINSKHILS